MPNGDSTVPNQNDPLGILNSNGTQPVQNDPLGVLKKKDGTPSSTTVANTPPPSTSGTQTSTPSAQPSGSTQNDAFNFRVPSIDEAINNQNKNTSSSTNVVHSPSAPQADQAIKLNQQHQKDVQTAIDNTTQKRLVNKGADDAAKKNTWFYNQTRQKVADEVKSGDAVLAYDKDGKPGLKQTVGFWDGIAKGWNNATTEATDADNFANNMTLQQKVDYAKQQQQAPDEQPNEYLGKTDNTSGKVGEFLGDAAPYLGKAAEGATVATGALAATPETFGASDLVGLPAAAAIVNTSKDAVNQGIKDEVLRRYNQIKKDHPEESDIWAMDEANKGQIAGGITGGLLNVALGGEVSEPLKAPISDESKNVLSSSIGNVLKSSAHMGAVGGATTAANDIVGNLQGVNTPTDQVISDIGNSIKSNATTGFLLTGLTHAAVGLLSMPNMVKNAYKFGIVNSDVPIESIKNNLENNEKLGNVPAGTAIKVSNDLQAYKEALDKTPNNLPPEAKAQTAGLIQKAIDLEQQLKTVHPSAAEGIQNQLDAVNKQLSEVTKTGNHLSVEHNDISGNTYQDEINNPIQPSISLPKIETNEEASNNASTEAEGQKVEEPKGAETPKEEQAPISTTPVSENIHPTETFRTLNYGDHTGEPESAEKQEQIKQDIVSDTPIGKTGEKFSDFVKRIIPAFKDILNKEENNTTLVTHSSVIKALDVWEDMGRPDVENMSDRQRQKFAEKYNSENPAKEGNVTTFESDNGNKIHAVRHGETEDNQMSEFRSNDTQLTDKGEKQAAQAGQELKKTTGGDVPKIITSDLPRTIHTSNIIHGELNPDVATPKEEPKTVGVSQDALRKIADRLGLKQPEVGTRLTPEEFAQRGRQLLNAGADMDQVEKDFKAGKQPTADDISVARAHLEDLNKIADSMHEKWGADSRQFKDAQKEADRFVTEVVKPMGTKASEPFTALQGERDLNTGSFTSVRRAVEDHTGKPLTPKQNEEATILSKKVKVLENKVQELQTKLTEQIDKSVKEGETDEKKSGSYAEKAKKIADNVRKLKNTPFTFRDENGNEITINTKGISWNDAVELGAKVIEKTGVVADGVAAIIDHIKNTDWYKNLSDNDKSALEKQLNDHLSTAKKGEESIKELSSRFVEKKDNKFEPQDVKDIWEYAKKEYLDKGRSYADMIKGVGVDLGLTPEQVQHAITQPRGANIISEEMYRAQRERTLAQQKAKQWVKNQTTPKWLQIVGKIPDAFTAVKTTGHGTVGMFTHAGLNVFHPSRWKIWGKAFGEQFKYLKSAAYHERAMEALKADPDFVKWKRAGLAIEPGDDHDDKDYAGRLSTKIGAWGSRGFDALKPFRLNLAKKWYDNLPESQKADPETIKMIAELANHSTGSSNVKLPDAANVALFAPQLEASRWARLIGDPVKAIKIFAKGDSATPAEKAMALRVAKNAGSLLATYAGALTVNAGLLAATGSRQKVNFTHPTKSDFLKLKIGDNKTLDLTGGMLSTLGFLASMANLSTEPSKDLHGKRGDKLAEKIGGYVAGKLSPFAGTVKDFTTQHDFSGNTLPISKDKPTGEGVKLKGASGWGQYLLENQSPIPISAGVKAATEGMKQNGMQKDMIQKVGEGIGTLLVEGGTGAHIGNSPLAK